MTAKGCYDSDGLFNLLSPRKPRRCMEMEPSLQLRIEVLLPSHRPYTMGRRILTEPRSRSSQAPPTPTTHAFNLFCLQHWNFTMIETARLTDRQYVWNEAKTIDRKGGVSNFSSP